MDRSGLDALHRSLTGNGTGRRSLLIGGLLSALALSRGAETKAKKRKRKQKTLWAVVDSDGSLAYGRGATSARQVSGNGAYEVTFTQDVSECAKIAEITYFHGPGTAYVTVGSTSVRVFTYDTNGGPVAADKGFHLMVMC
jgi:hypothetical protein